LWKPLLSARGRCRLERYLTSAQKPKRKKTTHEVST
jgi:hypothetical protein